MPSVESGSSGSQLRRTLTVVLTEPCADRAASIAARDDGFQITTLLLCTMPNRSAAAGDTSISVPPIVASSATSATIMSRRTCRRPPRASSGVAGVRRRAGRRSARPSPRCRPSSSAEIVGPIAPPTHLERQHGDAHRDRRSRPERSARALRPRRSPRHADARRSTDRRGGARIAGGGQRGGRVRRRRRSPELFTVTMSITR